MARTSLYTCALSIAIFVCPSAEAGLIVYDNNSNGGLAGFNGAAGNPPITIHFDSIAANTNITGATIAGVSFNAPGAPLIVVQGNATFTPEGEFFGSAQNANNNRLFPTTAANVLSPGGLELGAGNDPGIENDDLELIFQQPVSAFGFDHLSQSADGFSFTNISLFNQSNMLLFSGAVSISNLGPPYLSPGGADFWGATTTGGDLIARILIDEFDNDANFPDSNIGFDTFRFSQPLAQVPEPTSLVIFGVGAITCLAARVPSLLRQRRRRRSA
jgi:hypothetical protein